MEGQILVFYDDGSYEQYQNTWMEGDPESDPSLTPPAGRTSRSAALARCGART
jgi:hypothetical protein